MIENDPFPDKKPGKRLADVIIAVLGARTHAAAAKQLGISVATLRRWLKRPLVAKALTEARQELLDFGLLRLQRAVSRSVRKMVHLVDSPDEGVALRASLAVIDRTLTMAQHLDLVERVRSLEEYRSEEESKWN